METATLTREEIDATVQEILAGCLGLDAEEVHPEYGILTDLGAESIDLLDIVFRIEKAFGLRIERADLFPDDKFLQDPCYTQAGKLTEQGKAMLQVKYPYLELSHIEEDPSIQNIPSMYTVKSLQEYLERRLISNA